MQSRTGGDPVKCYGTSSVQSPPPHPVRYMYSQIVCCGGWGVPQVALYSLWAVISQMNPGPYRPLYLWGWHVGGIKRTALCQGGVR